MLLEAHAPGRTEHRSTRKRRPGKRLSNGSNRSSPSPGSPEAYRALQMGSPGRRRQCHFGADLKANPQDAVAVARLIQVLAAHRPRQAASTAVDLSRPAAWRRN